METNQKPWKTMKLPWKTIETNQKPWNYLEKPWKPTKNHEKPWNYLDNPWKPTKKVLIFRYKQTELHHNIYIITSTSACPTWITRRITGIIRLPDIAVLVTSFYHSRILEFYHYHHGIIIIVIMIMEECAILMRDCFVSLTRKGDSERGRQWGFKVYYHETVLLFYSHVCFHLY